jgi:hypothetical protein
MMRTHSLLLVTLALLGSAACSTSTPIGVVEAAGTSGSLPVSPAGSAGMGGEGPYVPSIPATYSDQPFTTPSSVSADWAGYLENFHNPALETIRLHFGTDARGQSTLTVVRGSGTPPAAPTDAYDQWPVPYVLAQGSKWGTGPAGISEYPQDPIAGFVYAAREVKWEGERLRFEVNTVEPWSSWCGLQTSYEHHFKEGGQYYTCDLNDSGLAPIAAPNECPTAAPPDKQCILNHLEMCVLTAPFCDCNATGCGPARRGMPFDITFYGDHADGSTGLNNVRLMPASAP